MKRVTSRRALLWLVPATVTAGCGGSNVSVPGGATVPEIVAARSLSAHYAAVEFEGSVSGTMAEEPNSYRIMDPSGNRLAVLDVQVEEDGMGAILVTEEQEQVEYEVGFVGATGDGSGQPIPDGLVLFIGTSMREPFLESAVSLSNTEILLTYSNQMAQQSAENVNFYEIADPDGNTDIDIRITGATLQPDLTTVILQTTPQENIEYLIRVTNVERRFSCDDEGRVFLDDAAQGTSCAGNYRPENPDDSLTSFVLTARTQIDTSAASDPDATGVGGSVGLEANGAGVRRPLCNGGPTGIDGGNGSDPDEELIFTADRAELAENVVLGVRELNFAVDQPWLFISSEDSAGFDFVIDSLEIQAAFNTGTEVGDIVFANLASLPAGLMIDAIKLRETNGEIWVHSICGLAINGRLIDPTRNTAQFFGIPEPDSTGPFVVRAESVSDTEVIVSFSEPLNSEAPDPLHFSISPDLIVLDAELTVHDTQVILTTTPQRVDVLYTVTVTDVYDKAGNLISNPNTATFSFVGGPASLGADALPRVVGAISTGNTTVTVAFSKPMGPSAEVASNYAIVQENVNPEVGALAVASASFLTPQMDAVELTTSAQGEVTYSLHVVNVRDLSGNQLAPPELLVDPSIAVFAGSPAACRSECTNGYVDPESGNSLCVTDDDCTAEDECEPGESCEGACEPCAVPDSDGDGIPDTVEQRGWVVFIGLGNGEITLREVTSDPFSKDTDGDGLDDATELRIVSDPRLPDSDGDSLDDNTEWNVTFSSPTDQDSDDDGIDDNSEVEFFKTNANLADSDGDGFSDPEELFEMNRDPRIADLPEPRIDIGTVDLHLDEQFTFVDEVGTTTSTESSTSSSLSAERTQTSSLSIGAELGFGINAGFTGGIDGGIMNITALGNIGLELNFGVSFQSTRESSQTTSEAFETSLSKGFEITGSRSTTREITGARIDALVTLANASDVAFSLSNLEITVSAPDQVDRTSLVPVATLVPNSELINGEPAVYNLGVLNGGRGPILFSSQDVFATQVEELMRDPRGLVFEFANYDISDEFERNFAFASQMARDRTVGIVIDFGDGDGEKFLVAIAPVRNNAGDIVGGFAGFEGTGPPPSLPLEYILEEVLGLRRGVIEVVTPVWEGLSFIENDSEGAPIAADGILVGPNGVSDSIAQGDDVQRIPFGIDGLPEDAVVIDAGE
ncbi:MAG: Ig-like domain-containing domain, partial [Planctomycetota bacterium]